MAKLGFLSQAPGCACRTVSLPPSVTGAVLVPGGGDVKIESQKLNFKEKAQAKVGSLDNVGHLPAGGAVKVVSGSPGDRWGRAGRAAESGALQAGAVTAPQSLQEPCPHTIAVFPSSSDLGEAGEVKRPKPETAV